MKKLIFTNFILLCLLVNAYSQSIPSYVPSNGLVGWWPFNGNANDESGNGNNGVVNNAILSIDRFGNNASSYNFNGNSTYIQIPYNANLSPTSGTVSTWIKVNGTFNNLQLILFGQPGGRPNLYVNSNYRCGVLRTAGFSWRSTTQTGTLDYATICGNSILDNGSWHFIVSTYTPNSLSIYVDGLLEGTTNTTLIQNQNIFNEFYIGGFGPLANNYQYFNGVIDDIGIWNRALSPQEITNLYNSQSCTSNTITADGPTTFCAGNSVNLTSDVNGGTYQWKKNGVNISTNATSRTYKATASGSYTCVATCNGTALTSNAIAVTSKTNAAATVTASGATSFCAGDSVTLNCTNLGSNYSVQWYRTNVSIENATNYTQIVKQPGTYKVVTKNLTNGCSRISGSSVVVAVNCRLANPDVIAADITESDFDAANRETEPKGKIYIYPNPTSDNKFTVELMGLEIDGNATLEVYNAMGQILSSEKVNITNGTLNRTIQIDEQSKGQLCLVRLITGSEVYDSKVILK